MRNISFALTTEQFRNRTKFVTRRNGWAFLAPGDHLMGCVKCMGLKPGEKLERLGEIVVLEVRREPLNSITPEEVILEGFPTWTPQQFIEMYCKHNGNHPDDPVNRIRFDYVDRILSELTREAEAMGLYDTTAEDNPMVKEVRK